jgi:cyclopropane-fatty-acyl-phospholipid synthase
MRNTLAALGVMIAERGAPDSVVRAGMRLAIKQRLRAESRRPHDERRAWLNEWWSGPVALVPDEANAQHYEVPAEFFELVLGPRLKYSSCLYEVGVQGLAAAEAAMLTRTCETAGVEDGMKVLDLGCGWGSLSLWIAEHYPSCEVVAVSNSHGQGEFIAERAASLDLDNVEHRVMDVNRFDVEGSFDLVTSVEMFEHVRNHPQLLDAIGGVLEPGGGLFVHHFAHRRIWWPFEDRGPADWMSRMFFSGGIMPSHDLLSRVGSDFEVERSEWIDGTHYQKTLEDWLVRLDANRLEAMQLLGGDRSQVQRWRMFLMACAEFFGYDHGRVVGVSHHLLRR